MYNKICCVYCTDVYHCSSKSGSLCVHSGIFCMLYVHKLVCKNRKCNNSIIISGSRKLTGCCCKWWCQKQTPCDQRFHYSWGDCQTDCKYKILVCMYMQKVCCKVAAARTPRNAFFKGILPHGLYTQA